MNGSGAKEAHPLQERHAVVTGGGRGIGAAVSAELARLGARLTLMGRNEETLRSAAEGLRQAHGTETAVVPVNLLHPEAISEAFRTAVSAQGPVQILVNNAGASASAPFRRTSLEVWRRMMDLNATAPLLCAQAVLPDMLEAGWGRIVNVASTAGLKGYGYVSAYCAAKHAVIGLTRSMAIETARAGVTVNAVCPGYTETDMVQGAISNITAKTGLSEAEARANLESNNPQGRLVEPGEVASAVGWLCLPAQGAVTGQSLVVAGGEVM